jgi:hypothetical protein
MFRGFGKIEMIGDCDKTFELPKVRSGHT